jgi:hypothetical protein
MYFSIKGYDWKFQKEMKPAVVFITGLSEMNQTKTMLRGGIK